MTEPSITRDEMETIVRDAVQSAVAEVLQPIMELLTASIQQANATIAANSPRRLEF